VERIKRLYGAGTATRDALDRAEAETRRTQARRRSAEFAVEVARFELEATRTALRYSAAETVPANPETVALRAPVDGRVLKIERKSEGVISAGQPLIEIGDPHALEVEVDVLSADAVRIAPGTRVLFERWGGERPLEGRVRTVEPAGFTKISALGVEEQRVWVIADITSPPEVWERLGDGYRVEASFILWEAQDVLQLPASALFRQADGWSVFIVENGKARRHSVQIGQRSGLTAEILSGLAEGETVIVHPGDTVEDGTRIRLRAGD
jgi:HlyD family secretion protein